MLQHPFPSSSSPYTPPDRTSQKKKKPPPRTAPSSLVPLLQLAVATNRADGALPRQLVKAWGMVTCTALRCRSSDTCRMTRVQTGLGCLHRLGCFHGHDARGRAELVGWLRVQLAAVTATCISCVRATEEGPLICDRMANVPKSASVALHGHDARSSMAGTASDSRASGLASGSAGFSDCSLH